MLYLIINRKESSSKPANSPTSPLDPAAIQRYGQSAELYLALYNCFNDAAVTVEVACFDVSRSYYESVRHHFLQVALFSFLVSIP